MKLMELMKSRHGVRRYLNKPIDAEKIALLQSEIEACNQESGLHLQLITEEPEAFGANKTHYGQFVGCRNYFACVGPKGADEKIGYYGERLVLKAQELGLNTCWVAMTYKKGKARFAIASGEKVYVVIALGYGENQGIPHKSKDVAEVSNVDAQSPDWFCTGIEAALLAPTAMNQQKFYFEYKDGNVYAVSKLGFYSKLDLGIAKYHFEAVSGHKIM